MHRFLRRLALVCSVVLLAIPAFAGTMLPRTLIAREGKGYLEKVGSQLVLHVKGTPEEMGRQHGALLKDHVEGNIRTIKSKADESGMMAEATLDMIWRRQTQFIPERYVKEMQALAEASGMDFDTIRTVNTIPELFHCSGFAVFGKATLNGTLYHGRILDYEVGAGLQNHAVVTIAEPDGLIPFVSVTYAGFIGSVTGMNLKKIGFGEMGGNEAISYEGVPMAFLMRRGLEEANTLQEARALFETSQRTCEYYYVISDANIPSALAVAATARKIEFAGPNEAKEALNVPIEDAVVMSADDRYKLLTQRIRDKWGTLDAAACLELMRRPVAMSSCLHCALMSPGTGEMWVAHASSSGEPASEQTYTYFNVRDLMAAEPTPADKGNEAELSH